VAPRERPSRGSRCGGAPLGERPLLLARPTHGFRTGRHLLAGLEEINGDFPRADVYLPRLYARPGFARDFDVMAPEGYAPKPKHLARILRTTRRIMRRFGDLASRLDHRDELGHGRRPPRLRHEQARAGAQATCCWPAASVEPSAGLLVRVPRQAPAARGDYWGYHNGLLSVSGRRKPGMRSFLHYLRKRLAARAPHDLPESGARRGARL
jgi:hypothetical protein